MSEPKKRAMDPKVFNLLKFLTFDVVLPLSVVGAAITGLKKYGLMSGSPLEIVGLLFSGVTLYKVMLMVYRYRIQRGKKPEEYGRWAIVTGSTSGIGKAYAEDLASRKMSLLLVSRNPKLLAEQKEHLQKEYGLAESQVEFLAYDFTDAGPAREQFYKDLDAKCKQYQEQGGLGLLVNNVGIANPNDDIPMALEEFTFQQCNDILNCNIFSCVNMTHTVLKYMKARKSGAVVCVSSGSGNFPGPFISIYSATKSFMTQFSRSMHVECWGSGVDFLVVTPFYVVSNLFKRKKGTIIAPLPQELVKGTFNKLGRQYIWESYGYWFHSVIGFIADYYWDVTARNRKMMTDNRKRADARKAAIKKDS